jgi:hypothetical protein
MRNVNRWCPGADLPAGGVWRPALLSAVLLALSLPASAAVPGAPAATAPGEAAGELVQTAERFADLVRDNLPLLQHRPGAETIWAALFEARFAVAEIDRLAANAPIYRAPQHDRLRLQDLAAESHLRLALFETQGLEFERARQELDRARALSDRVLGPDFRIEWAATQEGATGTALVTRFQRLTLPELEAALGAVWAHSRPVPVEFSGYSTEELLVTQLSRVPPPAPGSLDEQLVARATAQLGAALNEGRRSLTLPLPPGLYRLQGRPGGDLDRSFVVPEVSEADPVVLDRARFSLTVEPSPGPHGPWFYLNGVEVKDRTTMPYGVYRVKVDETYYQGAPQVVRFIMGEGISDKTRTSWTMYVPAGATALFQVERAPLGERLFRK